MGVFVPDGGGEYARVIGAKADSGQYITVLVLHTQPSPEMMFLVGLIEADPEVAAY